MTTMVTGQDRGSMHHIDPSLTAAVVVGVESYPEYTAADIPGVADEALGFAEWLVGRGVPPDRIFVCLSSLPPRTTGQLVAAAPSRSGGWANERLARNQELRRLFESELKPWVAKNHTDLLIVFWVGHGYVDDEQDRKLLCSDASYESWLHFDFQELRKLLGQEGYPQRQVLLFDACAVGLGLPQSWKLGEQRFTRGPISSDCRQFVLFSTSPGERSPGRGRDMAATFAEVFQKACDEAGTAGPWPPDLPAVASKVQDAFRTRGQPRPRFHNIGWDGDEVTAALNPAQDAVDEKRLVPLSEALVSLATWVSEDILRALVRELPGPLAAGLSPGSASSTAWRLAQNLLNWPASLGGFLGALVRVEAIADLGPHRLTVLNALSRAYPSQVPWPDVYELVRTLLGLDGGPEVDRDLFYKKADRLAGSEPAAQEITVRALHDPAMAVGHFAWTLSREPPEPHPLLTLLVDLASESEPKVRERLGAWVERLVKALGVRAPEPRQTDNNPAVFMVVADPSAQPTGNFKVDAWHFHGGEPGDNLVGELRTREELVKLIDHYLGGSSELLWAELFLPVEQLAQGLSGWCVEVAPGASLPLDDRYPVRLRSWDRIVMRGRYFNRACLNDWKWRWAKRPGTGMCPDNGHCVGLYEPDHYRPSTIIQDHSHAGAVCLAASLVLPGDAGKKIEIMIALLVAGTPILVWPQGGSTGDAEPCEIYQALKDFVKQEALERLPERVYNHRRRRLGRGEGPPADWRLCILWDDPGRLPPTCDYQLIPPMV